MTPRPSQDGFPFTSYKDYVAALARTDNAYQRLSYFLASPASVDHQTDAGGESQQVPNTGSLTIIDHTDESSESQQFPLGAEDNESCAKDCIVALNERPTSSTIRIVLLSYHRSPFTGQYTGVDVGVLNCIGKRFRVHPEMLMWHFGSEYGLDKRFFLYAKCKLDSLSMFFSTWQSPTGGLKNHGRLLQRPRIDLLTQYSVAHEFIGTVCLDALTVYGHSSSGDPSPKR